jgi:hypothetical protein
MSSRTKVIQLDKLARNPVLGSILLRLMMVLNDFAIANDTLGMWRTVKTEKRKHRRNEATRYLIELQVSHIYEGMLEIIHEMQTTPALKALVDRCDAPTKAEFAALVVYRKSTEFQSIMGRIRNNLAFHYDGKLVQRALADISAQHPGTVGAISMGHEPLDWHFEPGALVNERIAIREVFKIPQGAHVQTEADKLLDDLHAVSDVFGRFAGNFIWHHTS